MSDDYEFDFFVSFAGADRLWAEWIAEELRAAGYRVRSQVDWSAGDFLANMEEAVQGSRRLLALMSPSYLASQWCAREWEPFFHDNPEDIVPVLVEPVVGRSMLKVLVRINLTGLDEVAARHRLHGQLAQLTGVEPADAPPGGGAPFPAAHLSEAEAEAVLNAPDTPAPPPFEVAADRLHVVAVDDGAEDSTAIVSRFVALMTDAGRRPIAGISRPRARTDSGTAFEAALHEQMDALFGSVGPGSPPASGQLSVLWVLRGTATEGRLQLPAEEGGVASVDIVDLIERRAGAGPHRHWVIHDIVDHAHVPVRAAAARGVATVTDGPDGGDGPGGADGRLLDRIVGVMGSPDEQFDRFPHWRSLTLCDLADLVGADVITPIGGAGPRIEQIDAETIGVVPSPLSWRPEADPAGWCIVRSATVASRQTGPTAAALRALEENGETRAKLHSRAEADSRCTTLHADKVLTTPATFAAAVTAVARADVAIFDITSYEPAVMVLLGIRSVVRRGVTVCVADDHHAYWRNKEPPFLLREINTLDQPDRSELEKRIRSASRELNKAPFTYRDLPGFDELRAIPADSRRRSFRAFDADSGGQILALVPFEPLYRSQWKQLADELAGKVENHLARIAPEPDPDLDDDEVDSRPRVEVRRTLDLNSPRLVSAELFEAIRLTDFCLVDLSAMRPNVLFELGCRLAANWLHPILVVDPDYEKQAQEAINVPAAREDRSSWHKHVATQQRLLARLLQPIEYRLDQGAAFDEMVRRHLVLRELRDARSTSLNEAGSAELEDPRAWHVLKGMPPAGVFEIASRYFERAHEPQAASVGSLLVSDAVRVLPDQADIPPPMLYGPASDLAFAVEQRAVEQLIAAWLYEHHLAEHADGDEDGGIVALGRELLAHLRRVRLLQHIEAGSFARYERVAHEIEEDLSRRGQGPRSRP